MAFIKYGKHNAIQWLLAVGSQKHCWNKWVKTCCQCAHSENTMCEHNKVPNYERQSKKKRSQCHPHWLTDSWSLATSIQTHHIVSGCLDPKKEPKGKKSWNTRIVWITATLQLHYLPKKPRIEEKPLRGAQSSAARGSWCPSLLCHTLPLCYIWGPKDCCPWLIIADTPKPT